MRRGVSMVLVLAGSACGGRGPAPDPVYLPGFDAEAAVQCRRLPSPDSDLVVTELSVVGDSAVLVLDADSRRVLLLGPRLDVRWRVDFDETGPRGVARPTSAALVDDTLLYVADGDARSLKAFSVDGRERGSVPLTFSPQVVRQAGRGLLLSPLVYGRLPGELLYRLEGGEPRPAGLVPAAFADMTLKMLGNMTSLATAPDGRWALAHAFLVPLAFTGHGGAQPRPLAVPLPVSMKRLVENVPEPPVTADVVARIATVALALQLDAATGDLLYLTRTGQRRRGFLEKAILRGDSTFAFRRAVRLDVNAIHLAVLGDRRDAVVVTGDDAWYSCPLP